MKRAFVSMRDVRDAEGATLTTTPTVSAPGWDIEVDRGTLLAWALVHAEKQDAKLRAAHALLMVVEPWLEQAGQHALVDEIHLLVTGERLPGNTTPNPTATTETPEEEK